MPKIKQIKQFDRQEVRILGEAIESALQKVGDQYGVHIIRGNGRFDPTNLTLKIEASIVGENGEVVTKEAKDFKKFATMYGLNPSDLNKTFTTWNGKQFEITGLSLRKSKNPILAKKVSTGKTFIFPSEEVIALLNR